MESCMYSHSRQAGKNVSWKTKPKQNRQRGRECVRALCDRYHRAAGRQHCVSVSAGCDDRHRHLGAQASSWDPSFRQHNQRLRDAEGGTGGPAPRVTERSVAMGISGTASAELRAVVLSEPRWVPTQNSEETLNRSYN